jgi:hypothetical protein
MKIVRTAKSIVTSSIKRSLTIVLVKVILATGIVSLITSYAFGQEYHHYEMLNEYENHILDRYHIDYTGIHVRYMIESGEIDQLGEQWIKDSMLAAYNRFVKFNQNYFQNVPTVHSKVLLTGTQYIQPKNCDNFTKMICGDSRLIVGIYKKTVNDVKNNIRSIEIIEINNSGAKPYDISHAIFIEDFDGISTLLTFQDFPEMKLCGQCPIE